MGQVVPSMHIDGPPTEPHRAVHGIPEKQEHVPLCCWLQVVGVLKMRTFLSGMPECKLGLNDKVLFESQGRSQKQKVGGGCRV